MAQVVTLYLTCEEVSVRARVGYRDSLSTLEELVSRAIRQKVNNINTLCELFGITERLMLDVVIDLWHSGLVAIDFGRRNIYYLERATPRGAMRRGLVGTLENRSVMYDLVTGCVLPIVGDAVQPASTLVIPVQKNRVRVDDINPLRLRAALERALNYEQSSEVARRVIEVGLNFVPGEEARPQHWVPIAAEVRSGDDGHVRVNILGHPLIPASTRRQISDFVERYVVDRSDEPFSKRLAERAATGHAARTKPVITVAVAALIDAVSRVRPGELHEMAERHAHLRSLADTAATVVDEARGQRARVRIVSGVDENIKHARRLILKAKWQLVLASPFIRYARDDYSLIEELEKAVRKGVTVYLLWGAKSGQAEGTVALDENFRNAILRINEGASSRDSDRPRGRILASKTPAGIHAKIIIQDDEAALVTSLNFLDPSAEGVGEVGALVSRRNNESTCESVVELLRWARENYPDYEAAQTISTIAPRWAGRAPARDDADNVPEGETLPVCPAQPSTTDGSVPMDIASGAWVLGWQAYAQQIGRMADVGTTVRVIRDGEHKAIFDLALAQAKSRLIVTSDQISPEALTKDHLDRLVTLARAGVEVRLLYRTPLRRDVALGESVIDELHARAKSIPGGRLRVVKARNHAKVLIFDGTAVVTSFNFLSLSGKFFSRIGTRRESSEIGVIMSGSGVADKVLQAVGEIDGSALVDLPSGAEEEITPKPAAKRQAHETAALLAQHAAGSDEEALRDALRAADNPWKDLDEFERVGVSKHALLAAAEIALAERGADSSNSSACRWIAQLAVNAWEAADPVAAFAFAIASGQHPIGGLPSLPVVAIALAWQNGLLLDGVFSALVAAEMVAPESELDELFMADSAWMEGASRAERFAIVATAISHFILAGSEPAQLLLELIGGSDAVPRGWSDLAERAIKATGSGIIPFPLEALARPRKKVAQDPEQFWAALSREVESAEGKFTSFEPANAAWRLLYQVDHPLGKLKSIISRRDRQALAKWCKAHPLADLEGLLRVEARIEGPKVRTYTRALARITETAAEINSSPGPDDLKKAELLAAAEEFAGQVTVMLKELRIEAEQGLAQPCGRVIHLALSELRRVSLKG